MNKENLNGTLVLVRPDLTIDPAQGQGKAAIVTYDRQQNNEVYVNFKDGREAVYPPESLLQLKERHAVLSDLKDNGNAMPLNDFKDLYKIGLLLDRGTNNAIWQALELAGRNSAIWERALQPARAAEKQVLEKAYSR